GHGDTGDIHLLEGVLADQVLADVTGNEHHGGGVVVGGGNTGGQVGGAGAGGGETHTHLAGSPGVAVSSVGGALFVGGKNVPDLILIAVQFEFIVYIQNGAAGVTEYGIRPLLQQTFHQDLGCFHSHGGKDLL